MSTLFRIVNNLRFFRPHDANIAYFTMCCEHSRQFRATFKHYLSGPVRFPVDLRLYRRYEECTRWEAFVHKHFPDRVIPTKKKERTRFHKDVAPVLLADPEFQTLHQQFRTKIDLGSELLEAAIAHKVPLSVLLFDSWYLAEELVSMARYRKKDWISF